MTDSQAWDGPGCCIPRPKPLAYKVPAWKRLNALGSLAHTGSWALRSSQCLCLYLLLRDIFICLWTECLLSFMPSLLQAAAEKVQEAEEAASDARREASQAEQDAAESRDSAEQRGEEAADLRKRLAILEGRLTGLSDLEVLTLC